MPSLLRIRTSSCFAVPVVIALGSIACASEPEPNGDEAGDGDGDTAEEDPGDGDGDPSGDGDGDPSGDGDGDPAEALTYWKDAKAIIDAQCVTCHVSGGIGPFALETWEQVEPFAELLAPAIADLSMPPWPPNADCNTYEDARSLTDAERELLLEWVAIGYPEGDPADAPPDPEPPEPFVADFMVALPEPYTPTKSPDDWRCFVIPWPEDLTEPVYVTGQIAYPDQQQILHHVITFVADPGSDANFYIGLDEADPAPGYECFGGPGALDWSARWLGDWVPGIDAWHAPAGTGIEVAPGSILVVQMHYNTLAGQPVADQTSLGFQIADTVEQPGTFVPIVDYAWIIGADPMTIPAGDPDVHHGVVLDRDHFMFDVTLASLGVSSADEVDIWRSALHMHMIGTNARMTVTHDGGGEDCLVQIDDWDFNWQGDYMLTEPTPFGPGDAIQLDCYYDNSEANQPIVDGEPTVPATLGWGEGTLDEMCLGVIYAARK
jgi:hypothetical protein